jgi:SAM-dependent methyltransferase
MKNLGAPQHTAPLNLPLVAQADLNIQGKTRTNPLPWRGQFSPQLVETLLQTYGESGDRRILDPFVGSGTVLIEAARLGYSAFGAEINPAAMALASTYCFVNLDKRARKVALQNVQLLLEECGLRSDLTLFSVKSTVDMRPDLLSRRNLLSISQERAILDALIVLADLADAPLTPPVIASKWISLRRLIESLPQSDEPIVVAFADARRLPLPDASIDLIVTSPPYINVFNYHQQYRGSVEALGWDVLAAAKSEIGSNRKHRSNRLLTVIQYCLDMALVFDEMRRVVRRNGRMIVVVGRESNVRKTAFFNAQILAQIAVECLGLKVLLQQEREFTNRFGQVIREDILIIDFLGGNAVSLDKVREIAIRQLKAAVLRAPTEARSDFSAAISFAHTVQPSNYCAFDDLRSFGRDFTNG